MGVTTEVTGEGASIAPDQRSDDGRTRRRALAALRHRPGLAGRSADYFERGSRREAGPRSTSASFVGAGGVRDYVIGKDERAGDACRRWRR